MSDFTHINADNQPKMVDVGDKKMTRRSAIAQAIVILNQEIVEQFEQNDIKTKKGPVFQSAIIAGIQAVKKTSDLIPMCHPLAIEATDIKIKLINNELIIHCEVKMEGKTGVELEALTGASITALTVYDMCKSISHDMKIKEVKLLSKKGGKSDVNLG